MPNREIANMIETIKGRCKAPTGPVKFENLFECIRGFTLHYSGGSLDVKPGNKVSFEEDAIVIRATNAFSPDTSKPWNKGLMDALFAGLENVAAREHRIRWQAISGLT